MTGHLRLLLRREEGVLVRVLGLVGRRGFEAIRVDARPGIADRVMILDMTVTSDRPLELLIGQLHKLNEVEHVEVLASPHEMNDLHSRAQAD